MPQPNLVPVSLRCSRITHSNGVSGSTATFTAWPLIIKAVMLIFLDAFPQEIRVACIDRCTVGGRAMTGSCLCHRDPLSRTCLHRCASSGSQSVLHGVSQADGDFNVDDDDTSESTSSWGASRCIASHLPHLDFSNNSFRRANHHPCETADIVKPNRGSQFQIATIDVGQSHSRQAERLTSSSQTFHGLASRGHNFNTISLLPIASISSDEVNNQSYIAARRTASAGRRL